MDDVIVTFIAASLRYATPIGFAALAALVSARAGLLDVGIEGKLLLSAFTAVIVTQVVGEPHVGFIAGIVSAMALGGLAWFFHTKFGVDFVLSGLAMNLLASGMTAYLLVMMFGVRGSLTISSGGGLPAFFCPLESIPLLGEILFSQRFPVLLLFPIAYGVERLLMTTVVGLRIRAAGFSDGHRARLHGIDDKKYKVIAIMAAGALAGVGGSYLSIGASSTFVEGMSGGRGFIALAVTILGRFKPLPTIIWALVFGLIVALESSIGIDSIPKDLILMLPFIGTLATLAVWQIARTSK